MRGGAFFNGKEGRDDFRTNLFARGEQGSRKISLQEGDRGVETPFIISNSY